MKKKSFIIITLLLLVTGISLAQTEKGGNTYKTALGIRVDFGYGSDGIGFNGKHFFTKHSAIDASLLFLKGDVVGLGAEYQYNADIPKANGLQYYLGIGPQFLFGNDFGFAIRPVAGLDYKIPAVPIDFAFDWRPAFFLTPDTEFIATRFGLSMRYAF